jgi:glycosyltransferase involved in cell wall biosynthesis
MASPSEHYALAVTLPCYNDTPFLPRAVKLLEQATYSEESDFVLVIAEDGSDSSEVVGRLMLEYQNILYFHNSERLGRGKALMEAWRRVNADTYLFMDADMSTDLFQMNAYSNLLQKVREEHFDLVTGSRYHPDSKAYRPIIRWIASIVYNKIVRLLFRSEVSDHQCGFKAFSAHLIRALSDTVRGSSWFWDTEVIIIAQKKGFRVTEIPVFWVEMKGPNTPLRRLFKDIWLHGTGILGLLWRVYSGGL